MSKAEKFISDCTRNCSNQYDFPEYFENGIKRLKEYYPWLTPDDARKVAKIAREETINEMCKWMEDNVAGYCVINNTYDVKGCIEDLKKHLEDKV